jgi:hypothetical protein
MACGTGRHTGGFSVFGGVGSGGSRSPWIEFTKTGNENDECLSLSSAT